MTILPVPPSAPALSMRARLVSVPGLSLPYQLRISRTRSVVPTVVSYLAGGPDMAPRPPHSRHAPAEPGRERAGGRARDSGGHSPQVEQPAGAGRALDLQVVAEEVVELLERLDQQVVDREPDRPPPVRVAAEEARRRLGRLVVHAVLGALDLQHVGMLAMVARQRADAV